MYLCQDADAAELEGAVGVFNRDAGSMCQGIGIMAVGSVADHTGWLVCDTEITVLIENPYAGRIT